MNIRPLNAQLLVEWNDTDKTASWILVQKSDDLSSNWKVLAVGEDVEGINEGDIVYFPKYAWENLEVMDAAGGPKKYVAIKYSSLLAVAPAAN